MCFVDHFLKRFSVMKVVTENLQNHNLLYGDLIKVFLETCLLSIISNLVFNSLNERKTLHSIASYKSNSYWPLKGIKFFFTFAKQIHVVFPDILKSTHHISVIIESGENSDDSDLLINCLPKSGQFHPTNLVFPKDI